MHSFKPLFVPALALMLGNSAFSQVKKLPLDGKTYVLEVTEDGKKKPLDPDDLKFNAGKLKSSLFTDWGFGSGAYECTVDSSSGEKVYTFSAELKNDKSEVMAWEGTIKGEDIEGTANISKGSKQKHSYSFTGSIKKKKVPGKKE